MLQLVRVSFLVCLFVQVKVSMFGDDFFFSSEIGHPLFCNVATDRTIKKVQVVISGTAVNVEGLQSFGNLIAPSGFFLFFFHRVV